MKNYRKSIIITAWAILVSASISQAQTAGSDVLQSASDLIVVVGGGWGQFYNTAELQQFGLDILATLALAALIIYHPVRLRQRRTLTDLVLPRLFFLYALIGVTAGFLVVQHGHVIGFVIFGIGTLLRFRSSLNESTDTVEVIIVTLLGLSIGLGLPVIAVLVGVVTWVLIWMSGLKRGYELTLKGIDQGVLAQAYEIVETQIQNHGWQIMWEHRSPAKHAVEIVLQADGKLTESDVVQALTADLPDDVEYKINS